MGLPGVYRARKKDGSVYYRASITYKGKHVSLGSYPDEAEAAEAYREAGRLLSEFSAELTLYDKPRNVLPFEKWVVLINFRDNGIYIKTPIYLENKYFIYYFSQDDRLLFDVDDLFYYSNHKILRRGGHLFVSDFGMQVNILSRYGIKNFAVAGRDFRFVNNDDSDFRYRNIEIINRYHGVTRISCGGRIRYKSKIHINGDYIIGTYAAEDDAAIAYNKAADLMKTKGFQKKFPINYIDNMNSDMYWQIYNEISISRKLKLL